MRQEIGTPCPYNKHGAEISKSTDRRCTPGPTERPRYFVHWSFFLSFFLSFTVLSIPQTGPWQRKQVNFLKNLVSRPSALYNSANGLLRARTTEIKQPLIAKTLITRLKGCLHIRTANARRGTGMEEKRLQAGQDIILGKWLSLLTGVKHLQDLDACCCIYIQFESSPSKSNKGALIVKSLNHRSR